MTTELEGKLRLSLQNSGYSEGTVNKILEWYTLQKLPKRN
jgi:hypothetical protein